MYPYVKCKVFAIQILLDGIHVLYTVISRHVYITVLCIMQDGFSPLYVASGVGHTDVVDTLLKNGADPNFSSTVCTLL